MARWHVVQRSVRGTSLKLPYSMVRSLRTIWLILVGGAKASRMARLRNGVAHLPALLGGELGKAVEGGGDLLELVLGVGQGILLAP